jgi:hypothetical protein
MKKFLSIMLILFLIPVSVIFSSCKSMEEVAGTYKLSEVYSEGKTYKVGYAFNDKVLHADSAVLVLNKDENKTATYTDLDHKETISGIWDKKENIIIFKSSGFETVELTFELKQNGNLMLIMENVSHLLLAKQPE